MLMLTMREWFGASIEGYESRRTTGLPFAAAQVRLRGFITGMSLGDALRRIRQYEETFNGMHADHHVEFELLQVVDIPELSPDEIELSRATYIESMSDADIPLLPPEGVQARVPAPKRSPSRRARTTVAVEP